MGSRPFQEAGRGQLFFIVVVFHNNGKGLIGPSSRSLLSLAGGKCLTTIIVYDRTRGKVGREKRGWAHARSLPFRVGGEGKSSSPSLSEIRLMTSRVREVETEGSTTGFRSRAMVGAGAGAPVVAASWLHRPPHEHLPGAGTGERDLAPTKNDVAISIRAGFPLGLDM